MTTEHIYKKQGIELYYYEMKNDLQPLVLIHAQGVDAASFETVRFFFWSIHCFQYRTLQIFDFGRSTVFSSQGERRKSGFNYIDLSTVCHSFINQSESKDFVLYYFSNQYAWNFFREKSRERIKEKMIAMAAKYRRKYPDRNLKVIFWHQSCT